MEYAIMIGKRREKDDLWGLVVPLLEEAGETVYREAKDTKLSLILSGQYSNPVIPTGKKVLFANPAEWGRPMPPPFGYQPYRLILEEYYDEIVDLTGMKPKEIADKVLEYARG